MRIKLINIAGARSGDKGNIQMLVYIFIIKIYIYGQKKILLKNG